jgi:hypothetical protein
MPRARVCIAVPLCNSGDRSFQRGSARFSEESARFSGERSFERFARTQLNVRMYTPTTEQPWVQPVCARYKHHVGLTRCCRWYPQVRASPLPGCAARSLPQRAAVQAQRKRWRVLPQARAHRRAGSRRGRSRIREVHSVLLQQAPRRVHPLQHLPPGPTPALSPQVAGRRWRGQVPLLQQWSEPTCSLVRAQGAAAQCSGDQGRRHDPRGKPCMQACSHTSLTFMYMQQTAAYSHCSCIGSCNRTDKSTHHIIQHTRTEC